MTPIIILIIVLLIASTSSHWMGASPLNYSVTTGHPPEGDTTPRFWGFRNPTYRESTASHYLDAYGDRNSHKYPFYGYSLYGHDDNYYYPRINYLFRHNYPAYKYDKTDFKKETLPLRSCGHKFGRDLDETGLPSTFYVKRNLI